MIFFTLFFPFSHWFLMIPKIFESSIAEKPSSGGFKRYKKNIFYAVALEILSNVWMFFLISIFFFSFLYHRNVFMSKSSPHLRKHVCNLIFLNTCLALIFFDTCWFSLTCLNTSRRARIRVASSEPFTIGLRIQSLGLNWIWESSSPLIRHLSWYWSPSISIQASLFFKQSVGTGQPSQLLLFHPI